MGNIWDGRDLISFQRQKLIWEYSLSVSFSWHLSHLYFASLPGKIFMFWEIRNTFWGINIFLPLCTSLAICSYLTRCDLPLMPSLHGCTYALGCIEHDTEGNVEHPWRNMAFVGPQFKALFTIYYVMLIKVVSSASSSRNLQQLLQDLGASGYSRDSLTKLSISFRYRNILQGRVSPAEISHFLMTTSSF